MNDKVLFTNYAPLILVSKDLCIRIAVIVLVCLYVEVRRASW